jgi:hypothetical protein
MLLGERLWASRFHYLPLWLRRVSECDRVLTSRWASQRQSPINSVAGPSMRLPAMARLAEERGTSRKTGARCISICRSPGARGIMSAPYLAAACIPQWIPSTWSCDPASREGLHRVGQIRVDSVQKAGARNIARPLCCRGRGVGCDSRGARNTTLHRPHLLDRAERFFGNRLRDSGKTHLHPQAVALCSKKRLLKETLTAATQTPPRYSACRRTPCRLPPSA